MPLETIRAFQDHGEIRGDTVLKGVGKAQKLLAELREAGVDYDDVVETLEVEGVQKFADAFDAIVESIRAKRGQLAAA
jgi:transaldolase